MSYLKTGKDRYEEILSSGEMFILTAPIPAKGTLKAINRKDYTEAFYYHNEKNIFSFQKEQSISLEEFGKEIDNKFIAGYILPLEPNLNFSFLENLFIKKKIKKIFNFCIKIKKDKNLLQSLASNVTLEEKEMGSLEFIAKKFKRII